MSTMASQITGVSIAYPTVCSDQTKHQSSTSLAFVRESTGHRLFRLSTKIQNSTSLAPCEENPPMTGGSPHKWPAIQKSLPCHEVFKTQKTHLSCWCPPCYCWNAELCFIVFVVKFIVYVCACRGLGPKVVNKNIYLYLSSCRISYHAGQFLPDIELMTRPCSGYLLHCNRIS